MKDEKFDARRMLRTRLRALSADARALASAEVRSRLQAWWSAAPNGRSVAGFLPLPSEPDLAGWYRWAENAGGRLAFPRITRPGDMEFRLLPPGDWGNCHAAGLPASVHQGPHAVWEPDPRHCPVVAPEAIALVLVPGLGFAPGGARLGRGAGYYDRFLTTLPPAIPTVGITFASQILTELPCEPHDQPVDFILSEDGWTPGARGLPPAAG